MASAAVAAMDSLYDIHEDDEHDEHDDHDLHDDEDEDYSGQDYDAELSRLHQITEGNNNEDDDEDEHGDAMGDGRVQQQQHEEEEYSYYDDEETYYSDDDRLSTIPEENTVDLNDSISTIDSHYLHSSFFNTSFNKNNSFTVGDIIVGQQNVQSKAIKGVKHWGSHSDPYHLSGFSPRTRERVKALLLSPQYSNKESPITKSKRNLVHERWDAVLISPPLLTRHGHNNNNGRDRDNNGRDIGNGSNDNNLKLPPSLLTNGGAAVGATTVTTAIGSPNMEAPPLPPPKRVSSGSIDDDQFENDGDNNDQTTKEGKSWLAHLRQQLDVLDDDSDDSDDDDSDNFINELSTTRSLNASTRKGEDEIAGEDDDDWLEQVRQRFETGPSKTQGSKGRSNSPPPPPPPPDYPPPKDALRQQDGDNNDDSYRSESNHQMSEASLLSPASNTTGGSSKRSFGRYSMHSSGGETTSLISYLTGERVVFNPDEDDDEFTFVSYETGTAAEDATTISHYSTVVDESTATGGVGPGGGKSTTDDDNRSINTETTGGGDELSIPSKASVASAPAAIVSPSPSNGNGGNGGKSTWDTLSPSLKHFLLSHQNQRQQQGEEVSPTQDKKPHAAGSVDGSLMTAETETSTTGRTSRKTATTPNSTGTQRQKIFKFTAPKELAEQLGVSDVNLWRSTSSLNWQPSVDGLDEDEDEDDNDDSESNDASKGKEKDGAKVDVQETEADQDVDNTASSDNDTNSNSGSSNSRDAESTTASIPTIDSMNDGANDIDSISTPGVESSSIRTNESTEEGDENDSQISASDPFTALQTVPEDSEATNMTFEGMQRRASFNLNKRQLKNALTSASLSNPDSTKTPLFDGGLRRKLSFEMSRMQFRANLERQRRRMPLLSSSSSPSTSSNSAAVIVSELDGSQRQENYQTNRDLFAKSLQNNTKTDVLRSGSRKSLPRFLQRQEEWQKQVKNDPSSILVAAAAVDELDGSQRRKSFEANRETIQKTLNSPNYKLFTRKMPSALRQRHQLKDNRDPATTHIPAVYELDGSRRRSSFEKSRKSIEKSLDNPMKQSNSILTSLNTRKNAGRGFHMDGGLRRRLSFDLNRKHLQKTLSNRNLADKKSTILSPESPGPKDQMGSTTAPTVSEEGGKTQLDRRRRSPRNRSRRHRTRDRGMKRRLEFDLNRRNMQRNLSNRNLAHDTDSENLPESLPKMDAITESPFDNAKDAHEVSPKKERRRRRKVQFNDDAISLKEDLPKQQVPEVEANEVFVGLESDSTSDKMARHFGVLASLEDTDGESERNSSNDAEVDPRVQFRNARMSLEKSLSNRSLGTESLQSLESPNGTDENIATALDPKVKQSLIQRFGGLQRRESFKNSKKVISEIQEHHKHHNKASSIRIVAKYGGKERRRNFDRSRRMFDETVRQTSARRLVVQEVEETGVILPPEAERRITMSASLDVVLRRSSFEKSREAIRLKFRSRAMDDGSETNDWKSILERKRYREEVARQHLKKAFTNTIYSSASLTPNVDVSSSFGQLESWKNHDACQKGSCAICRLLDTIGRARGSTLSSTSSRAVDPPRVAKARERLRNALQKRLDLPATTTTVVATTR